MGASPVAETGARVVLVTCPDPDSADTMVSRLVEERVVACGNILGGVTSIYRWQGVVERAQEALVIFKTTSAGAARLVDRVPELHPYDTPEVLVLAVEAGNEAYLEWITNNVGGAEEGM